MQTTVDIRNEEIEAGSEERRADASLTSVEPGLDPTSKILVVDDEPTVQGFVVRVLTRQGFTCLTASNAAEAIAMAIKERPRLTITDIRMPGCDGTWLLAQLKEQCPEMAVVMLSAVSEARTAVDCLRAGADDYLVKPINVEELIVSTERSLDRAGRRRDDLDA